MATKITDDVMISDVTAHSAQFRAEAPGWVVSWLPGRLLTRNQAITAMTIAEHLVVTQADARAGRPVDSGQWWAAMEGWAAELKVSAQFAASEAEQPPAGLLVLPLAGDRTNRSGDPCPTWCVTDHNELMIPGDPSYGYMDVHRSAPLLNPSIDGQRVLVAESPGGVPVVTVTADHGRLGLEFSVPQARALAEILLAGSGGMATPLTDALQAAANMIAGVMLRATK